MSKQQGNPKDQEKETIFLNPVRKLNQGSHKIEPYQPEYQRLGLEPKYQKISSDDFQYAFNKRKSFVTSSAGAKKEAPQKAKFVSQESSQIQSKFPPQVKVSSGFNHEHTWRPTAEYYDEETIPPEDWDEQQYPWLDDTTSENLEYEDGVVRTGVIKDDEIPLPSEKVMTTSKPMNLKQKQVNHSIPEPASEFSIENVQDSQYCVIVRGKIDCICSSLEEVEHVVEALLFSENTDTNLDVSAQDIMVFKKLCMKVGVVLKE